MLVMVATALYVGFISPNSQASVSEALRAFGQCRVNAYDCRDFSTQFEAQAVYWACGVGRTKCTVLTGITTAGPARLCPEREASASAKGQLPQRSR